MTATTTKSQKAKGRTLQNQVRDDLIKALSLNPGDVQGRGMGQQGCDIVMSSSARLLVPFAVECKNQEHIKIWEALQQANTNAGKEDLKPLLVFKRNRSDIYACMKWEDLLALLGAVKCL